MKATVLLDNIGTEELAGDWGLSFYIEYAGKKILLDAVYEPHYARYKDDFGKTLAGFFSDEPGFYNLGEGYAFRNVRIGDPMPLQYRVPPELIVRGSTCAVRA